jgi:hypothetical protein
MTSLITIYYPPFPKPLCEGNMKEISLQIYTLNLKKASACSTHCWCTISAQTEPPIPDSMFLLKRRQHIETSLTFTLWPNWIQRKKVFYRLIYDHTERYQDKSNSLTQ